MFEMKSRFIMITYFENKLYLIDDVVELFSQLGWKSGNYPDLLDRSLQNAGFLVTALDNGKLIGLVSSIDDGGINAYVCYAAVSPNYQSKGIGKQMMKKMLAHYANYRRVVLISYSDTVQFYEANGFHIADDQSAMEKLNWQ